MADQNHYDQAADGLEAAAKALRACGAEEASEDEGDETPASKQPKTYAGAREETRRRMAQARSAKSSGDTED